MSPAATRILLAGARRRVRGLSTSAEPSPSPSLSPSQLPSGKRWDAVVIGGGHNGLAAAAYLARAGRSVAVLERRGVLGGAAVSESDLVPGFRFSRCSYLLSLLRPALIRELELERHGLKLLPRSPSSFTPCLDGRYLLLGPDAELNRSEIGKFSKKDAEAYPRYEEQLEKFCKLMDFVIDSPPPELRQLYHASMVDRMKDKVDKSVFWSKLLGLVMQQGQQDMVNFFDLLLSPASKILNNWFEGDVLKATLATDAVIGTMAGVNTPGSGYVLLHHIMGETGGQRGVWAYVEGGMGSVSSAISKAALEAGVQIVTNAEVSQVMVDENTGKVQGVALADGTELHSSVVLSNATPYKTFVDLVPANTLPEEFLCAIKTADYSSATTKINVAVNALPQFRCCKNINPKGGPEHMGTIHIGSESMEEIDIAYKEAAGGFSSTRPVIEMTIPSVLDKTISPPGQHVINLFVQYTPYKLSEGSWQDPAVRKSFAERCFSLIDEYAPHFSSSVIGYDMLTPPDLEREFGLTGGNIFHGAMGLDSLFLMRPAKGWSDYRTPVKGLYLCGSGAHPGGGVMGAPGRNAAAVVLDDLKAR
ncbi:pyridine nucleotide-disulfide oxidoreductase domain-containing protein 2-like [Triticum dicoccoides]|uniref:pyridine nucleotide-disulfide oxidoreductase domain-containing protein 2-like n=1 Tax=Triticum dicoccoides TaxID=85692 RepID=UPI00189092ED|nr:pyridine nucleotide-disulfide oxidoreductase domain-containing protein 2-like [Triticum dicoccoides]